MNCDALILAAGLGTRMKSKTPKVLHSIGGIPMLMWSIGAARDATGRPPYVVVGPERSLIEDAIQGDVRLVDQSERLGTGHAVMQAAQHLQDKSELVLVLYGDMPLLSAATLTALVDVQKRNPGPLTILTAKPAVSRGFGRILRNGAGAITGIMEEAHASAEQKRIKELNVGMYCFEAEWLWGHLSQLPLSPKEEYYLTDMIHLAVEEGNQVAWTEVEDEDEIIGVNNRHHLAEAQAAVQRRVNRKWMLSGVSMPDPASVYIGPNVKIGADTTILPNTHLQGTTTIGEDCVVGPNSIIQDSAIGDSCEILMSVVREAILEDDVDIGPFAHLRRGAHLQRGVHMGNFGEVKESVLGPGVKMGHFSYVGDTTIGENSNIGAGTVTCNFDGKNKNKTIIGGDVFIGSATMLVAPIQLGDGSRTGAGSVVTRDVADHTLVAGVPARAIRKLNHSD